MEIMSTFGDSLPLFVKALKYVKQFRIFKTSRKMFESSEKRGFGV